MAGTCSANAFLGQFLHDKRVILLSQSIFAESMFAVMLQDGYIGRDCKDCIYSMIDEVSAIISSCSISSLT